MMESPFLDSAMCRSDGDVEKEVLSQRLNYMYDDHQGIFGGTFLPFFVGHPGLENSANELRD